MHGLRTLLADLGRRPALVLVLLVGLTLAAVAAGSWAVGRYRGAVQPGPGPMSSVRSVWMPLWSGLPIPPTPTPTPRG